MTALVVQTGIYGDGMFGDRPEKDLDGVLDDVRDTGYDGVEVMSNLIGDPGRLLGACEARGLAIAGLHIFWWERDDPRVDDALRVLGTSRVIVSCLPVKEPADVPSVADELRRLAARARDLGVSTLLHNHASESRVMPNDATVYEALAERLPADEVGFVIDLHWAAVAGTLLRTIAAIGPRCDYYHLKDGSLTEPKNGRSYDLGSGEVDIPAAWQVARIRPVGVAAVERGYAPADQLAALRHDAGYARALLSDLP
jgi:sugar phosphate isomerase/epimerase